MLQSTVFMLLVGVFCFQNFFINVSSSSYLYFIFENFAKIPRKLYFFNRYIRVKFLIKVVVSLLNGTLHCRHHCITWAKEARATWRPHADDHAYSPPLQSIIDKLNNARKPTRRNWSAGFSIDLQAKKIGRQCTKFGSHAVGLQKTVVKNEITQNNTVTSVAIATYMFFFFFDCFINKICAFNCGQVSHQHTGTRSFFFFLLLAVSFQRCVVYREYPHYSRAFSPPHFIVYREGPHFSWGSSFLASILTSPSCLSRGFSLLASVLASPHFLWGSSLLAPP